MPYKLVPPRPGRTPYWSVRGTHCGIYLDRSTKVADEGKARQLLRRWREDAERGRLSRPGEPTFLAAVVAYLKAGGDPTYLGRYDPETGAWTGIAARLGDLPLAAVDQAAIEALAIDLYPEASPATRNRQVFTPVSAVLKHAGTEWRLRRPKGWRGTPRTDWMTPDQAFRFLAAAMAVDRELGILATVLLYCGTRLGETLRITCDKVDLAETWAWTGRTKNGEPRMLFLPPAAVAALAAHPRGLDRPGETVFRLRQNGRLYALFSRARAEAGPDVGFVTFHVFRHTWATWMRRYAGLDTTGLLATKAWKDPASVRRYEHIDIAAEARKALLLPVAGPKRKRRGGGESVEKRRRST